MSKDNRESLVKRAIEMLVVGIVLIIVGVIKISMSSLNDYKVRDYDSGQDLDVFSASKAANNAMDRSFEQIQDIITEDDTVEALEGVEEQMGHTFSLFEEIKEELYRDGFLYR